MLKREFINQKLKEGKEYKDFSQKFFNISNENGNGYFSQDPNDEFIDRTNSALERMDKSDMKGLSKERFLKELKTWQIQFPYFMIKILKGLLGNWILLIKSN